MSYFYLYDSYLQDKAYSSQLIRLETTLTDLGIYGKIGRLTLLKSIRDLIENSLREEVDTVVAVGNDLTLSQAAEVLAKHPKVTLGFIPLGQEQQNLAPLLGIPLGVVACHVLSGRLVETINLGKINNQWFLQSITTEGRPIIDCDHDYQLTLPQPHFIKISNLDWLDQTAQTASHPQRGSLDLLLQPLTQKNWWPFKQKTAVQSSLFPVKNIKLLNNDAGLTLLVDKYRVIKTPATIGLATEKLRLIVGKERKF